MKHRWLSPRSPAGRRRFRPALEALEDRCLPSVKVLTWHDDAGRTGLNPNETTLTPSNVNSGLFGKLFSVPVDGQVYAEPLYLPGVAIPGQGTHNVAFVATEHDSVYAFDADTGSLLWHVSFLNAAGVSTVSNSDVNCDQITPEIGITATPVIDSTGGTLYVEDETKTVSGNSTTFAQTLHALDVTTGADKLTPMVIQASVAGTGDGGSTVTFIPKNYKDRAGLLLLGGVVYTSFASNCDITPAHGWLIGYNAGNFQPVSVFCTSPNTQLNTIWMSNAGPAVDANGDIYIVTGNGPISSSSNGFNPSQGDYAETVLNLSTSGGVSVHDYFTPFNWQSLDSADEDFGSGGLVLLPNQPGANPDLLVTAGKEGKIYLINRDNMGQFHSGGDQVVQEVPNAIGSSFGSPAYFNNTIYYGGSGDTLKAFALSNGLLSTSPTSHSAASFGYPGTTPSISANGASNGIVWVTQNNGSNPAILRAYDANNLANELYDSGQAGSRDQLGAAVKFTTPMIANGKVYVGTDNAFTVFGLFNQPPFNPVADAGFESPSVGTGSSAFVYGPTGSPWSFSGAAGVAGNGSGFTGGNPGAPEGTQVAFVQQTGSLSQALTLPAGTYYLSFSAAQRANAPNNSQTFRVTVDGSTAGTITPVGTGYVTYTTAAFPVTAGTHTIAFVGLNPGGGDNTAFLDQVDLFANPVANAGFESPSVGTGSSALRYDPTGATWSFSGTAGIAGNGSGFTVSNPAAPEGTQVAFVQQTGSLSQTVTLATGTFYIGFNAAQRLNNIQTFRVTLDGSTIGTFTPSGASYAPYTTAAFPVTAGTHTIAFVGLNPLGGDNTAFLDQVQVNFVNPVADAGFESPSVGTGSSAFVYGPTGSPWSFSGAAGIAGNGSGFTAGNPNAPEGTQVAFVQQLGQVSQALTLTAGNYYIGFSAAQRANAPNNTQTFRLTVDGNTVGTVTPSGTIYAPFTTVRFTVSAGTHTIAFIGLNPGGGDNTAFIDEVTINLAQ